MKVIGEVVILLLFITTINTEKCQNGSIRPNMQNCAEFYLCHNGKWYEIPCPPYRYFNKTTNNCIAHDGSCLYVKTTPKPGCISGTVQHIENDCIKYRICKSAKWHELECPMYYYFNVNEKICKLYDGTCNQTVPVPIPNTVNDCINGTYNVDENNYKNYNSCVNGTWILKTCSNNTYFNSTLEKCILDKSSSVCTHGSVKQNKRICFQYFRCDYGNWSLLSCPDGYYFNSTNKTCSLDNGTCVADEGRTNFTIAPAKKDVKCAHGAIHTDKLNCQKYFQCNYGNWSSMSCPNNYYYNSTTGKYSINDGSCNQIVITNQPIYNCTNGALKKDISDCSKYFLCRSGNWTALSCETGYFFSSKHRTCLQGSCNKIAPAATPNKCKNKVNCTGPENILCEHGTDDGLCNQKQSKLHKPTNRNCTNGSIKPNKLINSQYFVCKLGKWSLRSCPKNLHFNSKHQVCLPNSFNHNILPIANCTDGIFKENIFNCSMYYLCKSGNWSSLSCPINFYFNSTQQLCLPDNGFCWKNNTIPLKKPNENCTNESIKLNEFNCTKYYLCKLGNWTEMACPNKSHFNLTSRSCIPGVCLQKPELPTKTNCTIGDRRPDSSNCSKYWDCTSGNNWLSVSCPSHYYYNVMKNICTIDDGTCDKKELTEEKCKNGLVVSDPFNCTQYLFCKAGNLQQLSCPEGFQFDINVKICVPGDACLYQKDIKGIKRHICNNGTIMNDINNCTRFYHCQSNHWYLYSCPDNYYFNIKTNQCMINDGNCCANGLYISDQIDANKFYQCHMGQWLHKYCPLYYKFDIDQKRCIFKTEKN